VFPDWIRELVVTVDLVAELAAFNAFDFFVEESAERWPFEYELALLSDLRAGGTAAPDAARVDSARAPWHRRVPRRAEPAPPARDPLPDPARAGGANA
jgi:hypothetical protein